MEAARFWTPAEAHMAQHVLEAEGVESVLFDTGMNLVELTGLVAPVRLMVLDEDAADAERVLAGLQSPR